MPDCNSTDTYIIKINMLGPQATSISDRLIFSRGGILQTHSTSDVQILFRQYGPTLYWHSISLVKYNNSAIIVYVAL